MIILDCEQGSEEWLKARCGIPTASNFSKIITPTGKASTQADGYMYDLLAEMFTQEKEFTEPTEWMLRGVELEAQARTWYEFTSDITVQTVGMVLRDDRLVGCSPDGLSDGGIEIKCPKASTHVKTVLSDEMPIEHIPQVQGCIWVCEREWWDFISYHPTIEPMVKRIYRDDGYIKTMETLMNEFVEKLHEKAERLRSRNC